MKRTQFIVLEKTQNKFIVDELLTTSHWSKERTDRHNKINQQLGVGKCIASFVVYTGHHNGDEIHNIMDNGTILIQNERTKLLVTELIARKPQLLRYWNGLNETYPPHLRYLLTNAVNNERLGRNNW